MGVSHPVDTYCWSKIQTIHDPHGEDGVSTEGDHGTRRAVHLNEAEEGNKPLSRPFGITTGGGEERRWPPVPLLLQNTAAAGCHSATAGGTTLTEPVHGRLQQKAAAERAAGPLHTGFDPPLAADSTWDPAPATAASRVGERNPFKQKYLRQALFDLVNFTNTGYPLS